MNHLQNSHSEYDSDNKTIAFEIVAENALLLSWQAKISLTQHNQIIALQKIIVQKSDALIIETVASYHCLMIYFNPLLTDSSQLINKIQTIIKDHPISEDHDKSGELKDNNTNCINIPVYYDIDQQWDLAEVAQRCNMSMDDVIKQHSANIYHGFALGFTPGFCYLASLPQTLHLPRKSSPRLKVPQGAVAIAEQQSAIYPIESPGGWHIIGQTPLPMYESKNGQFNATINVGQNVKFYAITKAEFIALQKGVKA